MSLTPDDVAKIAHLARLRISEEEVPGYVETLSRIIDFVAQLDAAETDKVEPMAHPLHMSQPLRDDAVIEQDQRELFQANAPRTERGLYLVPKVIE